MYKTELAALKRKTIMEIIRDYHFCHKIMDNPSMRIDYLLLENEDDFLKRFEQAEKRYNLLTENEKKKYDNYI